MPALLHACETAPGFLDLRRACLVRDLQGRVRLVVDPEPTKGATLDLVALRAALDATLGKYFAGVLTSGSGPGNEERRLVAGVLDQAKGWPPEWPTEREDPATRVLAHR